MLRLFPTTLLLSIAAYLIPTGSGYAESVSPSERYLQLADSASIFMRNERWGEASRYISDALRLQPANPGNTLLFSNLGVCAHNLGDYDKALQSFDISLIKAPKSPVVLLQRAKTYIALQRPDDAIADLNTAIASDSLNADALRLRSALLLRSCIESKNIRTHEPCVPTELNRTDSAMADFQRLTRISPSDPWPKAGLANTLCIKDPKGNLPTIKKLLSEALEGAPDLETRLTAINIYLQTEELSLAEEAIRQSLKEYPREGMLYLQRALLHRQRYQNEEAEIDKKIAVKYGVDSQTIESYFPVSRKRKR